MRLRFTTMTTRGFTIFGADMAHPLFGDGKNYPTAVCALLDLI